MAPPESILPLASPLADVPLNASAGVLGRIKEESRLLPCSFGALGLSPSSLSPSGSLVAVALAHGL